MHFMWHSGEWIGLYYDSLPFDRVLLENSVLVQPKHSDYQAAMSERRANCSISLAASQMQFPYNKSR
ncbi:hypothetical protein An08g09660 [Aspergillus niger]|uniref:Uncharacterized protein n=2 Tax=Aspergillus niger TaxID=5061 RepID=A5ABB0_ASPNC|nr:hypothetical protein An08g09660 [Aspergillus niger]CAK96744.1 hypothetical protein An08g09660 [Aspergillus niger]